MKINRPNFFSDTFYRNRLLYGKEGKYHFTPLDFWTDVYPNIIKTYLDTKQPEKGYVDVFTPTTMYPIGVGESVALCVRPFKLIFRNCFEEKLATGIQDLLPKDLKSYEGKKGMLGALSKIRHKIEQEKNGKDLEDLIIIFENLKNNTVHLTKYVPESLYDDFIKEIKTPFYLLAESSHCKEIKTEIDKIVFLKNPDAPKDVKEQKGYKIYSTEHCRSAIVFKNALFNNMNQDFFWDLFSFEEGFYTLLGAYFKDCCFADEYACPHKTNTIATMFEGCYFKKDFAPAGELNRRWYFIDCTFDGMLDFRRTSFNKGLSMYNCLFDWGSSLNMSDSYFYDNATEFGQISCDIIDTIFKGTVQCKKTNFKKVNLNIKNVSFLNTFYFDEAFFGEKAMFENIALPSAKIPKIEICKQVLANLLLAQGYQSLVEILGLVEAQIEKREETLYGYRSPLNMGWLNPTYAARYISRSKSFLAKARMKDRKHPTSRSIPFVGTRKSIVYPRTALDAYRSQDWKRLQFLSKKYGFGTKGKSEIKEEPDEIKSYFHSLNKRRISKSLSLT